MYSQLIGVISAEVAQTAGKARSAYVRRALRYGLHNPLPESAQMLRTVTEVQVTEICLGFGKRRKHSVREGEGEGEGGLLINHTRQHATE